MDLDKDKYHEDGFLVMEQLIGSESIAGLRSAFDDLFSGVFETGVVPDEVNWQKGTGDPSLTRQICNGWKSNRTIARAVLSESLGNSIGYLTGWPGVRIMIDNVLYKPAGAKSLGFHQDSAYLRWFTPSDLCTCWMALDDTTAKGGTIEFARGSHRWKLGEPLGEFHAPEEYRKYVEQAAADEGVTLELEFVEVSAGGGSFHHGNTWHGSGPNRGEYPRRALVLHAMRSDVEYVPACFDQGIGPIYSRYKRLADNSLDENYFPIIWQKDGYRTRALDQFLNQIDP